MPAAARLRAAPVVGFRDEIALAGVRDWHSAPSRAIDAIAAAITLIATAKVIKSRHPRTARLMAVAGPLEGTAFPIPDGELTCSNERLSVSNASYDASSANMRQKTQVEDGPEHRPVFTRSAGGLIWVYEVVAGALFRRLVWRGET
jgi:hypothetical protein